jgi:hypothetical protein
MDVHCARAERLNAIAWVCCFVGLAMAAPGLASGPPERRLSEVRDPARSAVPPELR